MTTSQPTVTQQVADELLGQVSLLAEQVGSAEGLALLAGTTRSERFDCVTDASSLRQFLSRYHSQVLLPLELPSICRAYHHACRYEIRELIVLDRQMAGQPMPQCFATASQRVGKTLLKRFRPLRDQRLVQRYVGAVEAGEAHAWHTLIYGLILSLYSLPLRQGLLNYAQQTTRGFVLSVASRLRLGASECRDLIDEACSGFPAALEQVFESDGNQPRLLVL